MNSFILSYSVLNISLRRVWTRWNSRVRHWNCLYYYGYYCVDQMLSVVFCTQYCPQWDHPSHLLTDSKFQYLCVWTNFWLNACVFASFLCKLWTSLVVSPCGRMDTVTAYQSIGQTGRLIVPLLFFTVDEHCSSMTYLIFVDHDNNKSNDNNIIKIAICNSYAARHKSLPLWCASVGSKSKVQTYGWVSNCIML